MKQFCLFLALFLTSTSYAQEKQIPIMLDKEVQSIDSKTAEEYDFFPEYDNFIEARMFQLSDTTFVLEIMYSKDKVIYRDRKQMTVKEKHSFQQELLTKIRTSKTMPKFDQSGRPLLLTGSTIIGLGYYGWAVPTTFDINNERAYISTYMLTAASGFLIPSYLTKNRNVSRSQAMMTLYGQSRGILHGIMFYTMLADPDQPEVSGAGVLGSVIEGFAAYRLAEKWDYLPGSASVMQMGGDFGLIGGFLLSDVLDLYNAGNGRPVALTTFLCSGVGLWAGKRLADTRQYTVGDAIIYRSIVAGSAGLFASLVHLTEPEKSRAYTTSAFIGGIAGGFVSRQYLKNRNFSRGHGALVSLGGVAGGLLGLGTGYLLAGENSKVVLLSSSAGFLIGESIMFNKYKNESAGTDDLSLNFSINPLGFSQFINKNQAQRKFDFERPYLNYRPEMFLLRFTF